MLDANKHYNLVINRQINPVNSILQKKCLLEHRLIITMND